MTDPITFDDHASVPAPVRHAAYAVAKGQATRVELLRAMWIHRADMTERRYVAIHLDLDRTLGVTIKGTYWRRWDFLIAMITEMLAVEAGRPATSLVLREGQSAVRWEVGSGWTWDPRDPSYTITALLGPDAAAGLTPEQLDPHRALPGMRGTLRYSDAEEFAGAPRSDWSPDDEDDFTDQLRDALGDERNVRILAVVDAGGCPDVDIRAGVVLVPDAPWRPEPGSVSPALVIQGEATFTVIEYPTAELAGMAFTEHVQAREHTGNAYDYVTRPGQPKKTAWPD